MSSFKRTNPMTDAFTMYKYHHIEFYCSDAQNHSARLNWALGMATVAVSNQATNNQFYASYVLKSNDMVFVVTAPYGLALERSYSKPPQPNFNVAECHEFVKRHGFAVKALGILVEDAEVAFNVSTDKEHGGIPVLKTVVLRDPNTKGYIKLAEIKAYGDVVLRYISKHDGYNGDYIPGYDHFESPAISYGLNRVDHVVGNVPKMQETVDYLMKATGMHYYAEFTTEDVGTVDSGLNSTVVSNNNHMVLIPINEPTYGTARKSQIQTYLEQNEGAGGQHIALKTDDIFHTIKEMRSRKYIGGFDFMPKPNPIYYKNCRARIGDGLTKEQYDLVEEYGILVDMDEQGILLQIFTRPIGDRATMFFEIIQRVGCMECADEQCNAKKLMPAGEFFDMQVGGCGGFGKGNFAELFKSIEDYERLLDGSAKLNTNNEIEINVM